MSLTIRLPIVNFEAVISQKIGGWGDEATMKGDEKTMKRDEDEKGRWINTMNYKEITNMKKKLQMKFLLMIIMSVVIIMQMVKHIRLQKLRVKALGY